jgi:hypothetical protein
MASETILQPHGAEALVSAAHALEREGRCWLRSAVSESQLAVLDRACANGDSPGVRLRWTPPIAAALSSVSRYVSGLFTGARPVRLVAFNKSHGTNWALPWHQDRVIALKERVDVPGFVNWTRKSGVWHAEPPFRWLERMVFARIHLDVASAENGCLELALGSHRLGKVSDADAAKIACASVTELCDARRGDVLLAMAPILHRSRASRSVGNRRALRIDYCVEPLPAPLHWELDT